MKLNINPYKGGLAAAAIAIAAVFYLGVWSNYESASGQRTGLEDKEKKMDLMMRNPGTASKRMVAVYKEYQDALGKETTNCQGYYKEKGALLTRWFSGISIEPNGLPKHGEFKARYIDEKNQLIRKLKDNKIRVAIIPEEGDAAKAEDAQMGFEEPTPENLKNLQKRFWIQEMLVNAMTESDVLVLHCEKMTFAAVNAPPGGAGKPPPAQAARLIPGNLGTVVSFELNVNLHAGNAPVLIENILKRSKDGFLVEIKKVELSRIADELANYPEFKSPEKQPSIAEKESYKPPALKPPMVKLTIQGEALDFDIK